MKRFLEVTIFAVALLLSLWSAAQFFPDPMPFKRMKVFPALPADAFRPFVYCFWSTIVFGALAVFMTRKRSMGKRVISYVLSCVMPHAALLCASLVFITFKPDSPLGVDFHRFPVLVIPAFFLVAALPVVLASSRKTKTV